MKDFTIDNLKRRIQLLEARGPQNTKICNKLRRKIHKLEKEA